MPVGVPHSPEKREEVMADFLATWGEYRSVTRACESISRNHGVAASALREWLEARDAYPSPAHRAEQLRKKNIELEEDIARLRDHLVNCTCQPGRTVTPRKDRS